MRNSLTTTNSKENGTVKTEFLVYVGQQAAKGFLIDTHRNYTFRSTILARKSTSFLCTMHWTGVLREGHGFTAFFKTSVNMLLSLLLVTRGVLESTSWMRGWWLFMYNTIITFFFC
jgi:hypothetical protein